MLRYNIVLCKAKQAKEIKLILFLNSLSYLLWKIMLVFFRLDGLHELTNSKTMVYVPVVFHITHLKHNG